MTKIATSNYELLFHLPQFASRRIQVQEVHEHIFRNCTGENWEIEKAGESLQKKPIYRVRYGRGPIKILLWSQMHGNEATATRAILELFQFLKSSISPRKWTDELSLYFLPLLNPDGAEAYTRENAAGIDLNRDALTLSAPESIALHKTFHEIQPQFSFNLHDQQIYYGVGNPSQQAAISLLAPPIDELGSMNENRAKAAKLVVLMENWLKSDVKLTVGKWSDEFEKRAFGEYCQMAGSATVLIEAGGLARDLEKTRLTQIYFSLLIQTIEAIIKEEYEVHQLEEYEDIPFNKLGIFDLIIRNANVEIGSNKCKLDLGIRREDSPKADGKSITQIGKIAEIGDLNFATGLEEWDADGTIVSAQKLLPFTFSSLPQHEEAYDLLKQGFGSIQLKTISEYPDYLHFPLLIQESNMSYVEPKFFAGNLANFSLTKNDRLVANIVNGYLHLIS